MSFILDNLIAEKKAVPMIVVMDNGNATAKDMPAQPAATSGRNMSRMAETLEQVYIKEIIPNIDLSYRTIQKKESRAMAGLSRGGMQTMLIGLNHLELFSYYGFFSGAIMGGIMDDSRKKLEALGIKSVSYISQGTLHEWHTWRRDLNEFAPLLFK
jgi:enterochelin esterase-like enzyme